MFFHGTTVMNSKSVGSLLNNYKFSFQHIEYSQNISKTALFSFTNYFSFRKVFFENFHMSKTNIIFMEPGIQLGWFVV
jgi:hypothetical protein